MARPPTPPSSLALRLLPLIAPLLAVPLLLGGCSRGSGSDSRPPLTWTVLTDVDHLRLELDRARTEGKPAVVNLTAAWCGPCQVLETYIADTNSVRERFEKLVRLKIDVTRGDDPALRAAVGLERGTPQMVFVRKNGDMLTDVSLRGWHPRLGPRVLDVALARVQ